MTIDELRKMKKREYALWFSKAKSTDLKEVLNNANLGGGISKFTKAMLIEVVMDLVDGIVTELTSKLKPKKIIKKRTSSKITNNKQKVNKEKSEEELMYDELMLPKNTQNFTGFFFNKSGETICQSGYFTISGTKKENRTKYLKLVKYYHPDNLDTGNEEKFKKIQEAWEMAQLKFDLEEQGGK